MSESRTISKTGAELQDVVELLDQLTGEEFLPYSSFEVITGGPAVTAIGSSTVGGYAMDDTSTEAVTTVLRIPNSLPGLDRSKPINVYIQWSSAATSGNVEWDVDYKVAGLGDDIGAIVSTSTVIDTTAGTADYASEAPVAALSASISDVADLLFLTVRREAGSGSDTMTGDASFNGVRISYSTNPNIV
jgi:hypothetical protein